MQENRAEVNLSVMNQTGVCDPWASATVVGSRSGEELLTIDQWEDTGGHDSSTDCSATSCKGIALF